MPRPEKVQAVADIKEQIESAQAVFVAEYAGLSVKEQQQLRRGLRASQSDFKVVKMTLARLAAAELGHEDLIELLSGPTGLAFSIDDAAATAKVLRDFAGDHAQLVIKGALLAGEVLPPERVSELANLEPREVLLSKVAGAFKAPMTAMAGLMAAMPRNLASMMQQLVEKKEEEAPAEAPVEESAAEAAEAPAEEAAAEETAPEAAAPEAETVSEEPADAAEAPAAEATTEESAPGSEEPAAAEGDEPAVEAAQEAAEAKEDK